MSDLNDAKFLNWFKSVIGLSYLKKGVVSHVCTEIEELQKNLLSKLKCPSFPKCGPCEQCNKTINKLLQEKRRFKNFKDCFSDQDVQKCASNYWEVAKYYMELSTRQYVTGPENTDCSGLLTIIINAKNVYDKLVNICYLDVTRLTILYDY